VNYYPFHIGDYLSATRHLSWDEDAAYRRLLDVCYTSEKPLPLDRKRIYRLVLAASKSQREAVDSVLAEFFVETPDGYAQERVLEELRSMREKTDASEEREEHEKDRMRRYRERRAAMFADLRERGVIPAWDVPMKELQRLYDINGNGPATDLQREQVDLPETPATAIPIPTPIPTPIPKVKEEARERATPPAKPEGVSDQTWKDWQQLRKSKRAPVTETVLNGAMAEAGKAGLSLEEFLQIWCRRGSQGLEASWITEQARASPRAQESHEQRNARIAAQFLGNDGLTLEMGQ